VLEFKKSKKEERMRKIALFLVILVVVGYFPLSVQGGDLEKEFWKITKVEEGEKGYFALVARAVKAPLCQVTVVCNDKVKQIFLEYFKVEELKELVEKEFFDDKNADTAITNIIKVGKKCERENRKGSEI
jgi:hypothetical protein